jgi:hypothetical protein
MSDHASKSDIPGNKKKGKSFGKFFFFQFYICLKVKNYLDKRQDGVRLIGYFFGVATAVVAAAVALDLISLAALLSLSSLI